MDIRRRWYNILAYAGPNGYTIYSVKGWNEQDAVNRLHSWFRNPIEVKWLKIIKRNVDAKNA